jgi:deoxyribodipyrimidine photolyase-related protein
MDIFLILPIHLYSNIDNLIDKKVYIIEDDCYFTDYKYHKLKLAYHRATMKKYTSFLEKNKINVNYIENKGMKDFYSKLNKKKKIFIYDMGDHMLENKLMKKIPKINIVPCLNFLVSKEIVNTNKDLFYNANTNKYNFMNFYKWQRKRLNILIDGDKPIDGKWTYDEENRKKLPKNLKIPNNIKVIENKYTIEAINYVNKNFPDNYGSLDHFIYPIDHESAMEWLKLFVKDKFKDFGAYEDAISNEDNFLFHSIISPMLNIGLITDTEVLNYVIKFKNKIPMNSFEGFIRQLIGWRNYCYSVYILEGETLNKNFLKHKNNLNYDVLWENNINIKPIADAMEQIIKYGYVHHIIRLMVLGNFFLLCQIKPDDVYDFYMEWSIDGYAWVMCTNIYGMSQYSDGGVMMTKPYFSSSNYIIKMSSDYKKSDDWSSIFDALFYNFIFKHQIILKKNYGTNNFVNLWNKKKENEQNSLIDIAKKYIKSITT